jgi:hypothetical protein
MAIENKDLAAHLSAAAQDGIISIEQANALTGFIAQRINPAFAMGQGDRNEERFKLIGGFNDIFVAIGIALVFFALTNFLQGVTFASPAIFLVGAAAIAWLLAEIFTARMRLALPSLMLSAIFCVCIAGAVAYWTLDGINYDDPISMLFFARRFEALLPIVAFIAAASLHYARFRVSIDVSYIVGGVLALGLALLGQSNPAFLTNNINLIAGACGIIVFSVAMMFDMADPERRDARSDAAFWLHLLASPLIVHPAIFGLAGGGVITNQGSPAIILALFALFTVVAIIIDRRALIVSGLIYAGGAIGYYLSDNLFGGAGITLLVLGGIILALSVGWQPMRRAIVPLLPLGSLKLRLPPA